MAFIKDNHTFIISIKREWLFGDIGVSLFDTEIEELLFVLIPEPFREISKFFPDFPGLFRFGGWGMGIVVFTGVHSASKS